MRSYVRTDHIPVKLFRGELNGGWADWCEERAVWARKHIGSGSKVDNESWHREYYRWYYQRWYGYAIFYFKHDADATAFALRWA